MAGRAGLGIPPAARELCMFSSPANRTVSVITATNKYTDRHTKSKQYDALQNCKKVLDLHLILYGRTVVKNKINELLFRQE